jgi:hypothetical protein
LEQWKWDIWEAESRAKQDEAKAIRSPAEVVDTYNPVQVSDSDMAGRDSSPNVTKQAEELVDPLESTIGIPKTSDITTAIRVDLQKSVSTSDDTPPTATGSPSEVSGGPTTAGRAAPAIDGPITAENDDIHTHDKSRLVTSADFSSDTASTTSTTADPSSTSQMSGTSWDHSQSSYDDLASVTANSSRISSSSPSPTPLPQPPVPPSATGGESIYRTIMNRLTALEANHTLYARYVEEQTVGVRDMLRRLGEEVGRLEGIVSFRRNLLVRRIMTLIVDLANRERRRRRCISGQSLNGNDKETGSKWNMVSSCHASITYLMRFDLFMNHRVPWGPDLIAAHRLCSRSASELHNFVCCLQSWCSWALQGVRGARLGLSTVMQLSSSTSP